MVRLAAAAEMWLGKPVIAINTATYWHALRQNKIADKILGLGRCWKSSESLAAGQGVGQPPPLVFAARKSPAQPRSVLR